MANHLAFRFPMMFLWGGILCTSGCAQATSSQAQVFFTASESHRFLRQPQGLEKISAIVGNVDLPSEEERWGEESLTSLVSASDIIVAGRVIARHSYFAEDDDSIATQYTVTPIERIKGSPLQELTFFEKGGKLVLSSGHSVEVHSIISDGVAEGQTYLFFLRFEEGKLVPSRDARGVARFSPAENNITLLDKDPSHDVELRREIDGASASLGEQRIRAVALGLK